MIPAFRNLSASAFPLEPSEDQQHHQFFSPNPQAAASSSSLSCHIYFSSTQDQSGYYRREIQQQQHQQEADSLASHGGSYELEDLRKNSLKISLWNKKDENETYSESNPVKWMSSKMRLMQKMKKAVQKGREAPAKTTFKFEDRNQTQPASPLETHNSGNSLSSNSNINPINPLRVCADCNTTKTPLWRSGPKGPKSLCNACGIRQRKAIRAMVAEAAAAAANGTIPTSETTTMKTKLQQKEKTRNISHPAQNKKRYKAAAAGPSHDVRKKLCFEEFFLNLSNNLAFHQVFPQDEKEAAILLMALSCGLVHG